MRTDIDHPQSFKEGVRVLLLMLRAKDGGSAKTDRHAVKKVITQSVEEFDDALSTLRARWSSDERIYSTINPRSIEKAIRLFKYRQLDADFFAERDRYSFYLDLENRWISCLKDKTAAAGSLFLFDVDEDSGFQLADLLGVLRTYIFQDRDYFLHHYPTRNGHHVITEPFNPTYLEDDMALCLHKNALMLWSY